jgi:hypothetical protein
MTNIVAHRPSVAVTPRLVITPYDPELADQIAAAEVVMKRDRDVLRKLAE